MFIDTLGHQEEEQREDNSLDDMPKRTFWQSLGSVYYLESVIRGAKAFGRSTYQGAIICFSHRRFIWLLPGYSFALYGHRYLEGTIAPAIAKRIMDDSSYSQIMVSGSNLGELVGAFFVLVSANAIKTPLPFIRFDALALLLVWGLPAYSHHIQPHKTVYAWRIAGMLIPISMGWAAGDVSLSAFIQSSLASIENTDSQVSPLGSVMSFLYSSYIIIYAILGAVLGSYIDKVFKEDGNIYRALINVGGVHFTILSVIIIAATLVPLGALRLNPRLTKNEKETDGSDVELRGDEREQETPTQLDFNHPVHQYRQVRVRAIDL
ncbi:hypothetical protein FRC20_006190 [Serendipita sp. 405]|nr:hypothetical protein FRC15_006165 [Serendipita sp. 397]KAG8838974.1 hypothetical protein FRC20_006190 [Serendipita sp. 405]